MMIVEMNEDDLVRVRRAAGAYFRAASGEGKPLGIKCLQWRNAPTSWRS